ncbi:hypothetical protein JCM16303_001814 [Sporobolomyces ruberrimus]
MFKRTSPTPPTIEAVESKSPSKLRRSRAQSGSEGGGWKMRFGRKGSLDSDKNSARRGSTESDSSYLSTSTSSSPSGSRFSLFDSPRTSISSSSRSLHRLATSSTPSLQITPPTPQLCATASFVEDELVLPDNHSATWPFSSPSSSSLCSRSSSSSSYASSSAFSLSSNSLASLDPLETNYDSISTSSPSLFLSYLLKYSFPQVPPRSDRTLELVETREGLGEMQGAKGNEKPRRLIDYYLDSSLRP